MNGTPTSNDDTLSRAVVHLTLFFHKESIATGTGIICFQKGRYFLVTALHNLSGREPESNLPKDKNGYVPNSVEMEGFSFKHTESLYDGENYPQSDKAAYCGHPDGSKIDVAVLPLNINQCACCLDQSYMSGTNTMAVFVSQTCFIVGFPEGLVHRDLDGISPIWKTGHIASEPHRDFNGEPIVLVDATTRPGLSGAPVFVRHTAASHYHFLSRLVGIYVGRYRAVTGKEQEDDIAIGRVFKPKIISEILRHHQLI
jgi:hypothetical protein